MFIMKDHNVKVAKFHTITKYSCTINYYTVLLYQKKFDREGKICTDRKIYCDAIFLYSFHFKRCKITCL